MKGVCIVFKIGAFLTGSFISQDSFDFFESIHNEIHWLNDDTFYSLCSLTYSLFYEEILNVVWVNPKDADVPEDICDIVCNDKKTIRERLNLKSILLVKSMVSPNHVEKKLKQIISYLIKSALNNSCSAISHIKKCLISFINVLRSFFFHYFLCLQNNEITLYILISDILVNRNTPLYHTTWRLHVFKPFFENK